MGEIISLAARVPINSLRAKWKEFSRMHVSGGGDSTAAASFDVAMASTLDELETAVTEIDLLRIALIEACAMIAALTPKDALGKSMVSV